VIVRVPASSANLGPGFDALGMALALHLEVGLATRRAVRRPADERHPAVHAFRSLGGTGALWVDSPIPMGRGLGFSGAARVGGLLAAYAQRCGPALRRVDVAADVLARATALEGHADNVAASLHGGVVATAAGRAVGVPLAIDPAVVMWVPPSTTSTDHSRTTLGNTVAFTDAVFNIGRTALLVAALAAGDVAALRTATEDRLHQDLRFERAPASRHALAAALAAGAWCGWLSGSGPAVAVLCHPDDTGVVAAALPTGASIKQLTVDHDGAVVVA
jgi:homoserine kinase